VATTGKERVPTWFTHLEGEDTMEPRLNVITLAVNDLEKSLAFYRDGLGLPTKGIIATEFKGTETEPAGAVVFFELHGGLIFALYPRQELAKDAPDYQEDSAKPRPC
jgi:catechol 2,3-dioxygenase-like lactoylglutathione lyase family enzyme